MRLVLLGVRGSTAAPGEEFTRYGGHTSCVAVLGDDERTPHLILDAGTGLRELPSLLGGGPFRGDVVLTHLHWDHVQGLPFCPAVDRPDARVTLHVPGSWDARSGEAEARRLLACGMSPPHFPIGPEGLRGSWRFHPARPGVTQLPGGASVTLARIAHKGGVALGVRVDLDGAAVAYLPDHALHGSPPDRATQDLVRGVDVLLHDGQFLASEQATAVAYGHATIEAALALSDACGVGRLLLVHHAPGRTDAELDALAARFTRTPGGLLVTFARQGAVVDVEADLADARVRPAGGER